MKTRVSKITNLIFSLTICLALQSCNKEEFYEKEYLDNPFQDPTTEGPVDGGSQGGVDSGVDGGTQGGVDSGTNGGTSGSTTGSSTGGTDGSTTGGNTTGGVDGSTTSGSTNGGVDGSTTSGSTTGGVDGSTTSGSTTGGVDGSTTSGSTTGSTTSGTTGGTDGSTTGGTTGSTTGSTTGGTTGSTTGGYGDCNNGHGNDDDGVDESNPTIGLDPKCKREVFSQASEQTKKLDIVWIIDNSGSMSDEQSALGSNFSSFINDFIDKNVDFKMAITTTDTSSSTLKGKMVDGSDVKLTSAKAKENETQFKADFNSLVKVGINGSGYEKGLAASEGFMQKYASTFLRSDAYLAVVVLSDEEDQSANAVNFYTDYLKSFKAEAGLVKVYTIADIYKTNSGTGITTGADRYIAASNQTSGVVADIRSSFHQSLSAMGDSIINLLDSFALGSTPVQGTLKVYINDVETTDYTYDSASNSIKFDANRLPPVGAEIEVYYIKQ